jgi:PAS domain S-box-containing protein
MGFLGRNIFYLIGAMLVGSVVAVLVHYNVSAYVLLAVALLLSASSLFAVSRQVKKLKEVFGGEENVAGSSVIARAIEELGKKEQQLGRVAAALKKIQDGNLDDETIGHLGGEAKTAIIDLQANLLAIKQQEARQTWIVTGIAKMGEIRKSNSSLEDYAYQITSTLVKYLEANQGAFYRLMPEENALELLASYAYGKRKFTDNKVTVDVGTGLLGQSVIERDLIFMTQVPSDYVKITSGLGEATPRCISIAPLIFREQVYGVIELASFQVLDKHHLQFIKEISESVAGELADIIRQDNTAKLLQQSQQQSQELKAQEEELRQNMEEMQATQEEMKRKEKTLLQHMEDLKQAQDQMKVQENELKDQLKQVLGERKKNQAILEGCVDGVVSFPENGKIQFCNKAAEEIFGRKRRDILFKNVSSFLGIKIGPNKTLTSTNGSHIGVRTEVPAIDKTGESISVLLTVTTYDSEDGTLFTLFMQKISVDLL